MRGAVRGVLALSAAACVVLAGCAQSSSGEQADASALQIVEQVRIDQNGDQVLPETTPARPPASPAGDGSAVCPPLSLATAATLTGPDAALGRGVTNGIQLAVDDHNAANPGCQVQLKTFDTEGDPDTARENAQQIVEDAFTLGVVGPGFSTEAMATGEIFDRAGMVAATPSATSVALADQGWRTFVRGLANDGVQGMAVANYIKKQLGAGAVCVVDDGTDYGTGLAQAVREILGPTADPGCGVALDAGAPADAATAIKERNPDAVFFAGYYSQSAPLVRALRDAGVTADFVSADGSKDPEFVTLAGESARDAVLSCSCGPDRPEFVTAYTEKFGQAPGTFSAGAYDLGTILLAGIDSGARTRPALLDFVQNYRGRGLEREYQWAENGELASTMIWIYKVQ
ncbi:branched-chain amino acid ABC transporter substrate-binding protein [[Mycobacterium] burgundiense]|uniref:Branched-chain amino acid ABC transporter substrate-binding protein n=1 Tax=[Mycobacterium] burgundiense TaxID=3064286 RepID=A0ABM9LP70_9MYCO|nr:branched-chain amino acid ABC transporter substrate-binding protein [Mycolicibacterium sp. MU0053]CAJ1502373.1 branched-chain amino acid ABC transporter substrate-binding protein [Mycolicibacterium sp. MU0053]